MAVFLVKSSVLGGGDSSRGLAMSGLPLAELDLAFPDSLAAGRPDLRLGSETQTPMLTHLLDYP